MKIFRLIFLVSVFHLNFYSQSSIDKLTASINGTIVNSDINPSAMISSENGRYWGFYEIKSVTDEMRELVNFKVYENETLISEFVKVPGSDISITNSGKLIFYDHSEHFKMKLKMLVYSKEGKFLFQKIFSGASQFNFSPSGNLIGVRTPKGIAVISLFDGSSYTIEKGLQFALSDSSQLSVVAQSNKLLVYKGSILQKWINTNIELPRKVIISSELKIIGLIDKYHLKIYSLDDYRIIFEDKINGYLSFRDLIVEDNKLITGIHKRNENESTGILRIYDLNENLMKEKIGHSKLIRKFDNIQLPKKNQSNYDPIPWPFFPFDSMRTVWNHYEQHMGLSETDSYLHQGLDLITAIGEPTYSVIDGYVKLVLTIGGDLYWRIAISPVQVSDRSEGWLSAHLIKSTIQFDIGDTVNIHDYLGDIIQWSENWGHIHFVNITDSGNVWYFNDNEWGINFNPALALTPYLDTIAPNIETVFSNSKFAFAINESSVYLNPDSLFGEVDIIVKVVDYVGDFQWQQPAYTTWYSIKRISDGALIQPKTLGHILNHKYPFFDSENYISYADVLYQRDNSLRPPNWMNMHRNFYHNLTNSDGDSLVELSEKQLGFKTNNYPDGDYRIIVEVYDESGNYDIDSMDVKFKNGNINDVENEEGKIYSFNLIQNYPNPFNPSTTIRFQIPEQAFVTLKIFDILGKEVATLVNEEKSAGEYEVEFNGNNFTSGLSANRRFLWKGGYASGIYFYQLKANNFIETKKMILLK